MIGIGAFLGRMRLRPRRRRLVAYVDRGSKGQYRWTLRDPDNKSRFVASGPPHGFGSRAAAERAVLALNGRWIELADPVPGDRSTG